MAQMRKLLFLLALLFPALARAQAVNVALATQKMDPTRNTSILGLPTSASVSAARNEFEAFEIFIYNNTAANLQNIDATVGPLNRVGGGGTIPATSIWIYREAYLFIGTATSNNEVPPNRYWPDALIPRIDEVYGQYRSGFQSFGPKDYAAAATCPVVPQGTVSNCNYIPPSENRVLFVDILVPPKQADGVTVTAGGTYQGSISVTWNGGGATVPINLEVYNFDLDSTPALKNFFHMFEPQGDIAHLGRDTGDTQSYIRWWKLYARYLLDHRITTHTGPNPVIYQPGSSNWLPFESTYAEFFDGVTDPKSRLKGARSTTITYRFNASDITDGHAQWESFFKSRGWWPRTFDKIQDEPTTDSAKWANIRNGAAAIHGNAATADFPLLVTTDTRYARTIDPATGQPFDSNYANDINIIVPTVSHVNDKAVNENGVASLYAGDQRFDYSPAYTGKLWWYQACNAYGCGSKPLPAGSQDAYWRGWPGYAVDVPTGALNRVQEWLTFRYGMVGWHYYEVFQNLPTAWQSTFAFGNNGDGTLLYPGTPNAFNEPARKTIAVGGVDDIPISSLRLKMIREGIEDFEYLKKTAVIDPTFANNAVEDLFAVARGTLPPPYNASGISVDAVNAQKRALANRITSGGSAPIAFRAASTSSYPTGGTQTLTASIPIGTQPGDILVAIAGFGNSASTALPGIVPPPGWTVVQRVDHGTVDSLVLYWHVAASGESSYTWSTDQWVGGDLSIMAYSGVSATTPIDVSNGIDNNVAASSYSAPSVTTTTPGDVLIATVYAHSNAGASTWSTPPGTVMRSSANNGGSRSVFSADAMQAGAGASSVYMFTASNLQDYAISHVVALKPASPPPPPPPSIQWRNTSALSIGISTTSLTINKPTGTASGDVLIAAVAMGDSTNTVQPGFTPPAGWTLLRRVNHDTSNALAIYWRVATATEPASYVWISSSPVKGVAWISSYSGVDNLAPIHAEMGQENAVSATQYSTPSINVTVANTMLVGSFAGYQAAGTDTSWVAPAPTNQRANLSIGATRSGTGADVPQASAPASVSMNATASVAQTYAMTHLLALKLAP